MTISHLEIGQASVPIVSSAVLNLGSWFDVNLKMTEQINNKTCQSVYCHLHNIRQIRKFFTPASTKLLVQAVIMEQNSAARLITHTPRYCHITPALLVLHWLPACYRWSSEFVIKSRWKWSLLRLFLRSNIIHIKRCSLYNLRSNLGVILQDLTATVKCTLGDRTFTAAAPKILNGLPDYIRKDIDFDKFKRLIKATCLELS